MADNTLALRAKAEGAEAWKNGDYQSAILHFSEAIANSESSNKEFLKVIYSNRSAAYLKVNKGSEALTDAEKCVTLDNNWTKGYTRKGDALFALRRHTDAYNAYNAGLRIDQNDSTLKEKSEQAMRAIRNSSTSSESGTSSTGNTSDANVPSSFQGQIRMVRLAVIGLGFLYLIPFLGSINNMAYRASAILFAVLNMYELYKKHGMPKFSSEYAARVMGEASALRVVLGGFLATTPRPYFFALVPALINELSFFLPDVFNVGHPETNHCTMLCLSCLLTMFLPYFCHT
jgi:tetratricopeptide (TPR) repeat protein